MSMLRKRVFQLAAPATLVFLVTAFWAPTLFGDKTLIHGDSLLHGLALWQYHAANLGALENLVWDKYTYGGHPLFAEGQGGFAFPLHLLLTRTVSPAFANAFAHWIEMLLAGAAIIGLGRLLKLSALACGFAAIAAIFSSYWIQMQQNMTISAATMSIPFILWAGEYWIRRRNWPSALLLGGATALGVVAGYPQCVHGAVIYVSVLLAVDLLSKSRHRTLAPALPTLLKTGALAVLAAVALSAVQLLPLLELTQHSHRAAGTAAPWFNLPFSNYLRGMLYALPLHELDAPDFFQVIGSLLTCALFTLGIFFKLDPRIAAHAIAAVLLLNLGMGGASPLTQILYDYHLVPGMHYFRQTAPYFLAANIGVALIAGKVIDALAGSLSHNALTLAALRDFIGAHKIKLAIFVAVWVSAFAVAGFDRTIGSKHATILLVATAGVILLARLGHAAKLPLVLLLALCAEVAALKLHEFHFGSIDLLQQPQTVEVIKADTTHRDYKLYSASTAFMYALGSPRQKEIERHATRMLAQLCGLTNLNWNIPSMMGALALPLRERMLLDPILDGEISATVSTPAGLRFIDLLAVKYITADAAPAAAAFAVKFHDPARQIWLLENTAAKPRFQTYQNYVFVNSSEAALQVLQAARTPTLTLEIPSYASQALLSSATRPAPATTEPARIEFALIEDKPTHYRLRVNAQNAGWLFLADANYPGWRAYIDGEETPVYTAQILGKAIYMPAGEHEVTISFKSMSFESGLRITLASLAAVALALLFMIIRSRSRAR